MSDSFLQHEITTTTQRLVKGIIKNAEDREIRWGPGYDYRESNYSADKKSVKLPNKCEIIIGHRLME